MKRLTLLLRSVLPADLFQLVFLCGVVCLTLAPCMLVWPAGTDPYSEGESVRFAWNRFMMIAMWPFIFAAEAGYFVCLWPGKRPARRTFLIVILPALVGLGAVTATYVGLRPPGSVLYASSLRYALGPAILGLWKSGSSLHFGLLGLVLVSIFASRLALGLASLPIAILRPAGEVCPDSPAWQGSKKLIWVVQGPGLWTIATGLVAVALVEFLGGPLRRYPYLFDFVSLLEAFLFVALALWLMGRENREDVRGLLRAPAWKYIPVGLAIPVAMAAALGLAHYLFDRADWAAHAFGVYAPPELRGYFALPDYRLLTYILAAFPEELIFRGVLQRQFTGRYGLWRGIFLVGVIWSAFHFYSDARPVASDFTVLSIIAFRIVNCVSIGFVLSWLTLRSKSLFPSTLAHAFFNICLIAPFDRFFRDKGWLVIGLWGLLALVLYRYWPVEAESHRPVVENPPQPLAEPAWPSS